MNKIRDDSLIIKISHIPEEGMEKQWKLPKDVFDADLGQINLAGPVEISGSLYRIGVNVQFSGKMKSTFALSCSRCLIDFVSPVEGPVKAHFFPSESEDKPGAEMELDAQDLDTSFYLGDEVDLYDPVKDYMALLAPLKSLCDEDCKGLCVVCGANLNEKECGCHRETIDPRLAALKKLKID